MQGDPGSNEQKGKLLLLFIL